MSHVSPWSKKATHASFEATQKGFGVTVFNGQKVMAYAHFNCHWSKFQGVSEAVNAAYKEAKKYVAQFGVS